MPSEIKLYKKDMKIGIIAAMSSEREQLARLVSDVRSVKHGRYDYMVGQFGAHTLYIMECGIGKVNAAVGTVELITAMQPDVIISSGVAGGIDAAVGVMDVVYGADVVYHDVWCGTGNAYGQVQGLPPMFHGDDRLAAVAASLQTDTKIHGGLICSGDKFITGRSELDAIKAQFADGLAVDMESGAIAQVCHLYGKPFLSFRIISDTPGADGHLAQYEDFWGTLANRSFGVVRTLIESLPENW